MRVQGVPWPLAWAVLQLGWRPGWLLEAPSRPSSLFSFSPAQLTVQEGANATFTCSFSNWSEHLVLNWYRLSPSKQNIKLASFHKGLSEPGRDPRFQVTRLPNGLDFHMSVLSARCNDSGLYLCGVISLSSKVQIQETPAAELRVTGRPASSQAWLLVSPASWWVSQWCCCWPGSWPPPAPGPCQIQNVFLRRGWRSRKQRAAPGGGHSRACLRPGLRGAGLRVARENPDPRAPCLLHTHRVCHHRLPPVPGPQGLGRQSPGSPASETGGRTLLLAPLTTSILQTYCKSPGPVPPEEDAEQQGPPGPSRLGGDHPYPEPACPGPCRDANLHALHSWQRQAHCPLMGSAGRDQGCRPCETAGQSPVF
ncbi:programmed cell death protein 1 isoform X2 [Sciurus carolinensis]|uniref:programmed cell death protein 1 isoform X2 n=1 Tax=Sciurus carolinensis TaxID=30640 RepID=UPI001FB41A52|nr:programmed cell death protein 1 isoform X2 [Sciurus carolinensis]